MTGNSSIETNSKDDSMMKNDKPRFLASNLEQIRATNPNYSVWLEASAGSGKTEVLIKRVVRLIINGALTEKILCLTYTNAASVEIRTRLQKSLNELLKLNLEQLSNKVRSLSEDDYSFDVKTVRENIVNWQTNFHKMRVNTIHGYCDYILRNFPIEAGVPPNFNIATDLESKELLSESITLGLKDLNSSFDNNLHSFCAERIIDELSSNATVKQINDHIKKLIMKSNRFVAGIRKIHKKNIFYSKNPLSNLTNSEIEKIYFEMFDKLSQLLKFDVEKDFKPKINSFLSELTEIAPLFHDLDLVGTKGQPKAMLSTFKQLFEDLVLGNFNDDYDKINYIGKTLLVYSVSDNCYLIKKASYLTTFINSNQGHKTADAFYKLQEICEGFSNWYNEFVDHTKKKKLIHYNSALTILAIKVLNNYNSLKSKTTLLDFDDLIYHTKRLLIERDIEQPWILYKLDGGIDHLLLDEAQDTSSDQWKIIEALFANFFIRDAGSNIDNNMRKQVKTIFVVGDFKQSIYSFQGAKPQAMKTMKQSFEKIHNENNLTLQQINLPYSYRSGQEILNFVDMIFSEDEIALLGIDKNDYKKHLAIENNPSSSVEVYACRNKTIRQANKNILAHLEECLTSLKSENTSNANRSYIQDIGERIATYIKRNVSENKFNFQDVMILLRRRTSQMQDLVSELQKHNIPIHGVDRIDLLEHSATLDCLNLLKYHLQSDDNYTLFSLLTSPIIGLSFQEVTDYYRECDEFIGKLNKSPDRNLEEINNNKNYFNLLKVIDHKDNNYKFEAAYDFLFKVLSNKTGSAREILFEALFNSTNPKYQENIFTNQSQIKFFDNGYTKLANYYGLEVKDLIEEMLNVVSELEGKNYTIYEIISYFDQNTSEGFEIKREIDKIKNQNAVRILTIHSAKGLEAPVVILADSFKKFDANRNLKEAWFENDISICVNSLKDISASHLDKFTSELLNDQLKEFFRLLYVALTRASVKLVIYLEKSEKRMIMNNNDSNISDEFSWQNLILDKLKHLSTLSENKDLQISLAKLFDEVTLNNSDNLDNEKNDLLYLSLSDKEERQTIMDPDLTLNEEIVNSDSKITLTEVDQDQKQITLKASPNNTNTKDNLAKIKVLNPSRDIIYTHPNYQNIDTKNKKANKLNKQQEEINKNYGTLFHQVIKDYDQLILDKSHNFEQLKHLLKNNNYKLTTDYQQRFIREITAMLNNPKINDILNRSNRETPFVGKLKDPNDEEVLVSATIDLWYKEGNILHIYDLKTKEDCRIDGWIYNQLICYSNLIKNIFSNCKIVSGAIFSKETKLEYLQ